MPDIADGCECQSASLNFRPWACAGVRNPSPAWREGRKVSDRGRSPLRLGFRFLLNYTTRFKNGFRHWKPFCFVGY